MDREEYGLGFQEHKESGTPRTADELTNAEIVQQQDQQPDQQWGSQGDDNYQHHEQQQDEEQQESLIGRRVLAEIGQSGWAYGTIKSSNPEGQFLVEFDGRAISNITL